MSHAVKCTYDANGNRRTVHGLYRAYYGDPPETTDERNWTYTYDLDDPATYGSMANRLIEVDFSGPPPEHWGYYYDELGNVLGFDYDKMGRVWRMGLAGESGPWYGEFRYLDGRQRYVLWERDALTGEPLPGGDVWSDYIGEAIYADYTVDAGGLAAETRRYLPGLWEMDVTTGQTLFMHTDFLGSVRMMTDDTGGVVTYETPWWGYTSRQNYTAFGEPYTQVALSREYVLPTRYGYAGSWGYETLSALGPGGQTNAARFHVGERFYDATLGRFLQRDPIGIFGGLNVYPYSLSQPGMLVDPDGLTIIPVGDPMGPYPVPPGGRVKIRIKLRPPLPKGSFWKPNFAFRLGPHGAMCAAAFVVGFATGVAVDKAVGKITGRSLSDRAGDLFYRTCPSCFQ